MTIHRYHSVITASKKGENRHVLFHKGVHLQINNIQILRKEFLRKVSFNSFSILNKKLYAVFEDNVYETEFVYYGPVNIRTEDIVKNIRNNESAGIMRLLQLEGDVYQLLSIHIAQYDGNQINDDLPPKLLKEELNTIKKLAETIIEDPASNYSLEQLSHESRLSQVKLQEGFKYLFARTVTEYIRHTRLEAARDLMNTTDLNISQIVYFIGFTSRSYFSKIFKENYGLTPLEFKKQIITTVDDMGY